MGPQDWEKRFRLEVAENPRAQRAWATLESRGWADPALRVLWMYVNDGMAEYRQRAASVAKAENHARRRSLVRIARQAAGEAVDAYRRRENAAWDAVPGGRVVGALAPGVSAAEARGATPIGALLWLRARCRERGVRMGTKALAALAWCATIARYPNARAAEEDSIERALKRAVTKR